MPLRRPQLQLRIARGPQLQQPVVAAVVQFEPGDWLRVAAVEALGEPEDGRQRPYRPPAPAAELPVLLVAPLRRRLAVITGNQRDDLDLFWIKAPQVSIFDQIAGMLVMAFVADVNPDIVQKGRIFEPFALVIGQAMDDARLVEKRQRQARHLLGVLGPVVTPLGELEHAPAPHVGIPVGLSDLLAVPCDVVEDEAFAKRQVAEGDVCGAQASQDRIQQDAARDREVCAPWFEPGDA